MGKIKKEKNSRSSQEKKSDGDVKRNTEKKKSSNDDSTRKYGYISPASVILMAEAAGFSGIQEDVARNLAEDVTYRLRYIIQQCKKYMIHCKRKKLSTADINEVLKMCDIPALYGYTADKSLVNFTYIKEAEVFVLNDGTIDLPSYALSEILVQKKPAYYASGAWLKPEDKIKTESKGKEVKSSNSEVQSNNENVKLCSKTILHNDSQRLESENEENETKIPTSLIKYYGITCNTILGHSDLKIVFQDLSTNSRIGPIIPYLLNFITIALNKLSSERQLKRLLQTVEALSRNKSIDFSPYSATTRVINAMLLVVASDKKLGKISFDFHLRSYAARVLSLVLNQWCSRDEQKSTIVKKMGQLLLDFKVSPKVHYGAITLLTALGPKTLDESLWKILNQYLEHIEGLRLCMQYKSGNDVAMLEEALLSAATSFYRSSESNKEYFHSSVDDSLSSCFGDAICNIKHPTCSRLVELSNHEDAQEKDNDKKFMKPFKYLNTPYKRTPKKLSMDSVFSLPKPKKRKNTKIIFKFAGAIPVPEMSLKRRRFCSQYYKFVTEKQSKGNLVVTGKAPKIRRKDPRAPSFVALLFSLL